MNPIGIIFPLSRGNQGYFAQSFDSVTQIQSNIINLLRTNEGERRMQPTFSNELQKYLFEQNLADSPDLIKNAIENQIKMWIPGVTVKNIDLNISQSEQDSLKDMYILDVKIQFLINNNQLGLVSLSLPVTNTSNT